MNSWSNALNEMKGNAWLWTRVRATSDETVLLTTAELDRAYDEVRDSVDLVADYPEDGCFARSQILFDRLQKKGIETEKVFLTPLLGELRTETMKRGSGWRYHVATVALTSDQGAQVLDPLVSDDPIPLKAWFKAVWRGGVGVVSVHEPTKYMNGLTFSRDSERHTAEAEQELRLLRKSVPEPRE